MLKHGHTVHGTLATGWTREYSSWKAMRNRCNNPNTNSYQFYGARGIQVCERWNDFRNFYVDMGPRPEGCSLDRIDVNGNYCPENCRWATLSEQRRNQRRVVQCLNAGS